MKIKLSALHTAIDFDYSPEELVTKLGDIGIEVESMEVLKPSFSETYVARVVRTEPHPTHDKLTVVDLDLGPRGTTSVCTAATNVQREDLVPVILPGGKTADGLAIGGRMFGTVLSSGMLGSWKELALDGDLLSSDEKEGIFHLRPGALPGQPFEEAWPVSDTSLEISVTPDRGDALSVLGLARWIEVLKARDADRPFDIANIRLPLPSTLPHSHDEGGLTVTVEDQSLCSSYVGVLIRDVVPGSTNHAFRTRLYQSCVRPVNRIVDMTNLCLKLYGQPTHAFDYDRLAGHHIIVRQSISGETIITLDGTSHDLEPGTLVIADADGPVAIAGVMGGLASSVKDDTTSIVFEIAHFDPRAVARASRHLGIKTDAAYLYERGTDPGVTVTAVPAVLSNMVREQCVGSYVSDVAAVGIPAPQRSPLDLDVDRVNRYLGSNLDAAGMQKLFSYEGIVSHGTGATLTVVPPSFRTDLTSWPEYVEEIVRMQGYDEFPSHAPMLALRRGSQSPLKALSKRLRGHLAGVGLYESRTISFVHQETITAMGLPLAPALLNPLSTDWDALRPNLLPGLAGAAARNLSRGRDGFASFEIGKTFSLNGGAFAEATALGILLVGKWQNSNWTSPSRDASVFVLKGVVESVLDTLHIPFDIAPSDHALLEAGAGALVSSGSTTIGTLGIVKQSVASLLGLEREAFYAELSVDAVLTALPTVGFKEFSKFPSIRRDIAVVVDTAVPAGQLQSIITQYGGPLLTSVVVFDNFQGGSLPAGKKSIGFSMEFTSFERTLVGEEVDTLVSQVESALTRQVGGLLRRT
ncbi:MAG: phenylalanine--tRNA ligase subunit beta [Candidatus Cryosericum sp.]